MALSRGGFWLLKFSGVSDDLIDYPTLNLTEPARQEFLRLVVMKGATRCWSWAGEHDADFRPVFRGEKAYRVMYELRIGDVPAGFHIYHKCENSACVNPRHLVAFSPEDHRAVHATKNNAIKQQIYRGEWAEIQAAKAEAERLERERAEEQRRERERIAAEKEEEDRQFTEPAERWKREHPWLFELQRFKSLSIGRICATLTCVLLILDWRADYSGSFLGPIPTGVTLPRNYVRRFNEDMASGKYANAQDSQLFTTGAVVPPAIWTTQYSGNTYPYPCLDKDPLSSDAGYIQIWTNSDSELAVMKYGGNLSTSYGATDGFSAADGYWEALVQFPPRINNVHTGVWVTGARGHAAGMLNSEIDLAEWGYAETLTSDGSFDYHIIIWNGTTFTVLDCVTIPLPAGNAGGWYALGLWIQPANMRNPQILLYLDGQLVRSFSQRDAGGNAPGFHTAMKFRLTDTNEDSNNNAVRPPAGAWAPLGCKYVRCWVPN